MELRIDIPYLILMAGDMGWGHWAIDQVRHPTNYMHKFYNSVVWSLAISVNSLRPSDAYMRQ